ncbi:hypothetical protein QUF75_00415 [Desulfococcaceae bacterium HSG7]|nr:hypothetical protein [Desulfococcaceae bacterium HSG7]
MRNIIHYLYKSINGTKKKLDVLRAQQWHDSKQVNALQYNRLTRLIKYAYKHVPYYRNLLSDSGVVNSQKKIILDNFSNIPLLDKQTIKNEFERLQSDKLHKRKWHYETTGGSTGEPTKVIHDLERSRWIIAMKGLRNEWCGVKLNHKKVHLWGSERDLFVGKETFKTNLNRWLNNSLWLNAFRMTTEDMYRYVETINRFCPIYIKGYATCLYEFAQFIRENKLIIHSPQSIVSCAGTLTHIMRTTIEQVFQTSIFNNYGSRDVQAMAFECSEHTGLHVLAPLLYLEIIRDDGSPTEYDEVGEVIMTPFFNYAMPLIRYRIGDMAYWAKNECTCGRHWPLLGNVSGRVTECFRRKDGGLVPPEYFIHLFGVVLNDGWIKKFQIIQEELNRIRVLIVCSKQHHNPQGRYNNELKELTKKIKHVMSENCAVHYDFLDDILPTSSGKYLYTISKVNGNNSATKALSRKG